MSNHVVVGGNWGTQMRSSINPRTSQDVLSFGEKATAFLVEKFQNNELKNRVVFEIESFMENCTK